MRSGKTQPQTSRTRFAALAASVLERKVKHGDIWSRAGREKWSDVIAYHLVPVFGEMFVDAIERADIETWHDRQAERVLAGEIAASSATTHLGILRQTLPDLTKGLSGFRIPPGKKPGETPGEDPDFPG